MKLKPTFLVILSSFMISTSVFCQATQNQDYPLEKVTIVGGGIGGVINALFFALNAQKKGEKIRITIYEKNSKIIETTAACISPSLTTDEMSSVIPPVDELLQGLKTPFDEPGGIRVMDVKGIDKSPSGKRFLREVSLQDKNKTGIDARQKALLLMGKMSMDLWIQIYEKADPELRAIFEASNFRPCREPRSGENPVAHGYRIDLLYGMQDPVRKAKSMLLTYTNLGYQHCRLLYPEEVITKDPTLRDFCETHSLVVDGKRQWRPDSVAILRPGGCLNTTVFIPQILAYLTKHMGTYVNPQGKKKLCFQLKLNRKISRFETAQRAGKRLITGLKFENGYPKKEHHIYQKTTYLFSPGEAVGTAEKLGFKEPAYAGFAGASLILNVTIPPDKKAQYQAFTHWMEVHKPGVVLAWQGKSDGQQIVVACGGTKAFYADKRPHIKQAFAVNRNLLQLNMMNDVVPWFLSLALHRDTKGKELTQADMDTLVHAGIAKRWVGVRAVAFDGMPTISYAYLQNGEKIENGLIMTHLGSGGVSFAPAAAAMVLSLQGSPHFNMNPSLTKTILKYGDSARTAQHAL